MSKSFNTLAVHAGEDPSQNYGAVSVPIYNSTVFVFEDADEAAAIHNYQKDGYFYGRLGNPTQAALEKAVAELESGDAAYALASGMAAVSGIVLSHVKTGDHIVAPDSMYSTTTIFLQEIAARFGIETTLIDATVAENYAGAIRENTRLFWLETPSNPLLRITDIRAVSKIARSHNILTAIDNTFATPFNQRPLEFGVDLVMHSATKYFSGHSDLTAGLVVGDREAVEKVRNTAGKLYGGNIAPQVAWLVLRGIKTLALRMERHNQNAYAIANMLVKHPSVHAVHYPGLPGDPGFKIARKQMSGFGGMVSFDVGGIPQGKALVNNVGICSLATSLGGVETIIQHSASMTHAALTPQERLKAGVTDGLIRLSVGIEDEADLIEDLQQALENI